MDALPCQRAAFDLGGDDVAYLNVCSCSPIPRAVADAAKRAVDLKTKPWSMPATTGEGNIKRLFAQVLNGGVEEQDIALCPSTSYAMSLAAASVDWSRHNDPSVVVLDQQFPSNVMPFQRRAKLRIVKRRDDSGDVGDGWTAGVLAELAHDDVACVAIPHAHWTDGSTLDVYAIAKACKTKGVPLALDLTQTLGAAPIAVGPHEHACDATFVACSVHKHLYSPYGASLFYCARRHQARLQPLERHERQVRDWPDADATGESLFDPDTGYPAVSWADMRKADAGGRPNPVLMPALQASLELVVAWGPSRIADYVAPLAQVVEDAALAAGFHVARPRVAHIVGLRPPAGSRLPSARALAARLASVGVVVSVRCGVLRVSFGVFNTLDDAARLAQVLQALPA